MFSRFRSLFFLLFVAIFFVSAASVIFYAFGYRFSYARGIFIYTGSLSLKTNIETVNVKIDDTVVPNKRLGLLNNSIQITGLTPGEHFIEVSAAGYRSWTKKIVIQSGMTTEFWNILLTEENPPLEPIAGTENVIKVFPAPNGLFAVVKKQSNTYTIETLDVKKKESSQVFSTDQAVFLPERRTNLEWSPESHKIIIPLMQGSTPAYAIVNIKTKETAYLNDMAKTSVPLSSPRWDATARDFLFYLDNGSLYRIDTEATDAEPVLIKRGIAAYEISGSLIYYLSSENGVVYQIPGNSSQADPQQITPSPAEIDMKNTYSLIAYDEDRLAILEESSGTLTIFNPEATENPLKKIQSGVVNIQYSDDGKKLLYSTNTEIFVYFNQDWNAQPMRSLDTIIQVARFSTPIKNTEWAEDYEHVIFSQNETVKVAELDNRDRRNIFDLISL